MTRILFLFILLLLTSVKGAVNEPFPQGYAMGNLGTIVCEHSPSGRSARLPAAYMSDTLAVGVNASVTTYYDDMDNYADRHLTTAIGCGWLSVRRFSIKTGISRFDALGAYREFCGFVSLGTALFKGIRVGAGFSGTRFTLSAAPRYDPATLGEARFALRIPVGKVSISSTVDRLTVKSTRRDGADPDPRITCAVHTSQHIFGAQGVRITIIPALEHPVSIAIGQEFRFSSHLAIHGGVANNPLFIGIGIAVFFGRGSASAAMVNHPILGWSRGISAEYGWNPQCIKKQAGK